jgi:hypothetical protein
MPVEPRAPGVQPVGGFFELRRVDLRGHRFDIGLAGIAVAAEEPLARRAVRLLQPVGARGEARDLAADLITHALAQFLEILVVEGAGEAGEGGRREPAFIGDGAQRAGGGVERILCDEIAGLLQPRAERSVMLGQSLIEARSHPARSPLEIRVGAFHLFHVLSMFDTYVSA